MTDDQWNSSRDPEEMFASLVRPEAITERKLRYLATSFCRRIWHLLDRPFRYAVEMSERLAEGEISEDQLRQATTEAEAAYRSIERNYIASRCTAARCSAATAVAMGVTVPDPDWGWFTVANPLQAAAKAARHAAHAVAGTQPEKWARIRYRESSAQANLVRSVVGRPLDPLEVDPRWLSANDQLVTRIAQSVYEHRRLPKGTLAKARLGVLSDALMDAGCNNEKILDHLREPLHVRACHVVDALLSKNAPEKTNQQSFE